MVCTIRLSELCRRLAATAGGFARIVAAVVLPAAMLLLAAGLTAAALAGAALFAATGLTAATLTVAPFAAATLLVAAVVFATAARSSSAGRLGAAARSGRSRTGRGSASRSGAARLAARGLAATAGMQPFAQARPAALGFAARRGRFATAATTASLDLRGGQQQQAQRQRKTTGSALHGRNSSQPRNTTKGENAWSRLRCTVVLGAAVAFRSVAASLVSRARRIVRAQQGNADVLAAIVPLNFQPSLIARVAGKFLPCPARSNGYAFQIGSVRLKCTLPGRQNRHKAHKPERLRRKS